MKKAKSTEMTSIRKKLLAAVAMLLVACVMTVSSTYAWFTLSTAPEVKGITTTVGANGNLEMALGKYDADVLLDTVYGKGIPSAAVADSAYATGKSFLTANTTWGNLVDLSDESYGLGAIKLYPTRLNANGTTLNSVSPLKYAQYGSDGRVTDLATALKGMYDNADTKNFIYDSTINPAGVSGIGSVSNMSKRELAFVTNKNLYINSVSAALDAANKSITLYGADLAGLLITHMNAGGTDSGNYAGYVPALTDMVNMLQTSNDYVGEAIKAAILTYAASGNAESVLGADDWEIFNTACNGLALDDIMEEVADIASLSTDLSAINGYYNDYVAINTAIGTVKTDLAAFTGDNVTWDQIRSVIEPLVNTNVTVCGFTRDELTANKDVIASKALADELTVEIPYASGKVYSDLADMLGTISGVVRFNEGTEVEGMDLGKMGVKATLKAYPASNAEGTGYISGALVDHKVVVRGYSVPITGDTGVKAFTDTYGYIIDLLFRTNASDSYLKLQTEAANRIYKDNTNDSLMGAGSNMIFTASADFSAPKVTKLMEGIRVVFIETPENATDNSTILAVATLDTENAVVTGDQVKADLQLIDFEYSADGVFIDNGAKSGADADKLVNLSANTIKRISVLVYLDGDVVDNSYVSALANVEGKLNLQFGSSEVLKPMDNNALMNNNANA